MTQQTKIEKSQLEKKWQTMPAAEQVMAQLATAETMDDFFGREGIFAKLFAKTLEDMLAAELGAHLGYERYAGSGRNSGNSRNGYYEKKVRTSNGETVIQVPRDREGTFEPQIVPKYERSTNELEKKIWFFEGFWGKREESKMEGWRKQSNGQKKNARNIVC